MSACHKILVLVPFPFGEEGVANRRAQVGDLADATGVQFDFRPVKVGPAIFDSNHDLLIADVALYEAGLEAQRDGYDALCIDTVSDSGVAALRSVLDIPVVGPGKASFLIALLLGDKFSVVSMWKPWELATRKGLRESGLESKCASVRSLEGFEPDVENLLAGKEDEWYPQLLQLAQRCIDDDGAEVILLASTTMHQAHGYLSERLDVPVINPGPLSYKMAESLLVLGLTHSRVGYRKPAKQKDNLFHSMLDAGREAEQNRGVDA